MKRILFCVSLCAGFGLYAAETRELSLDEQHQEKLRENVRNLEWKAVCLHAYLSDFDATDEYGWAALDYAVFHSHELNDEQIIQYNALLAEILDRSSLQTVLRVLEEIPKPLMLKYYPNALLYVSQLYNSYRIKAQRRDAAIARLAHFFGTHST